MPGVSRTLAGGYRTGLPTLWKADCGQQKGGLPGLCKEK